MLAHKKMPVSCRRPVDIPTMLVATTTKFKKFALFAERLALILLSALLLPPTLAHAVDVTLLAGYQFNSDFENGVTEEDIRVKDGGMGAIAVDFPLAGYGNERLGFYLSYQPTRLSDNSELEDRDLDISHLHFTAMTAFPSGRWEPFILLGIGAARYAPGDSSLDAGVFLSGQIAGGASLKITETFLLRFGARWIPTFFDGGGAALCNGDCTVVVKTSVWNQGVADIGLQFRF